MPLRDDPALPESERLPSEITLRFEETLKSRKGFEGELKDNFQVQLLCLCDNTWRPIGSPITDMAYEETFFRYHDVLHFAFAVLLNWSPVSRGMLGLQQPGEKRSRADIKHLKYEEEAIVLFSFDEARRRNFFRDGFVMTPLIEAGISTDTRDVERYIPMEEWIETFRQAYACYTKLIDARGGIVHMAREPKSMRFEKAP